MMEIRKNWSDGKSAMLCVIVMALAIPIMVIRRKIGVELWLVLLTAIPAMAFFWSALWRSRCRDVWAWLSLLLGFLVVHGITTVMIDVARRR
jgi:hypothetical protein